MLDAAECAVKYGARGTLMTDWGDFGHIQFDFTMQLGLIYSGAVSWSLDGNREFELACEFADAKLYKSTTVSVSSLLRRGADIYDEDYFWIFLKKFDDNHTPKKREMFNREHYTSVKLESEAIEKDAEKIVSDAPGTDLLKEELIWSAKMYAFISDFMLLRVEFEENGKLDKADIDAFLNRYDELQVNIKRL